MCGDSSSVKGPRSAAFDEQYERLDGDGAFRENNGNPKDRNLATRFLAHPVTYIVAALILITLLFLIF